MHWKCPISPLVPGQPSMRLPKMVSAPGEEENLIREGGARATRRSLVAVVEPIHGNENFSQCSS